MRSLFFSLIVLCGFGATNTSFSIEKTEAQIKYERNAFMANFGRIQDSVDNLQRNFLDQRKSLGDLESKISRIENQLKNKKEVDTSKFATKKDLLLIKADIEKFNKQWSEDQNRLSSQIQKDIEDLKALILELNQPKRGGLAMEQAPKKPAKMKYPGFINWEIRPGDSFSVIAREMNRAHGLNLSLNDIQKANPKVNSRKLTIKQIIKVPVPLDFQTD